MASLLRQIVAGPRARHPEAGLDLCYVTDDIIATSGPSGTYPQLAYRNPLKDLVKFLDEKHGEEWAIWEFRAEGTGYPDEEVYGRVRHYPWPDHHPPPFQLVPLIVGSMRNWLKEDGKKGRVVVVHCKAGKGRSGTISCSYLIAEEGWEPEKAMQRFTERRMKPGFGAGLSIPSQIRWISYVNRWTKHGKKYVERPVEILEVHAWGLRDGVKIAVEGYVEEGKKIKTFHTFRSDEREIIRGGILKENGFAEAALELMGRNDKQKINNKTKNMDDQTATDEKTSGVKRSLTLAGAETGGDVIFRPEGRVVLPSSDVNIDFERRNRSKYGGFTMVTAVAHVWFNAFFEGNGPENDGSPDDSGVFEIEWDAIDGIKGSSRKGTRAFDRVAVVWKALTEDRKATVEIREPSAGEEVKQATAADWRGAQTREGSNPSLETEKVESAERKLGLRVENPESRDLSRASSLNTRPESTVDDEIEGVRSHGPGDDDSDNVQTADGSGKTPLESAQPATSSHGATEDAAPGVKHVPPEKLPGGVPEDELDKHHNHAIGSLKFGKHMETSS